MQSFRCFGLRPFLLLISLLAGSMIGGRAESVIFIHPDGAGMAHWQALRFLLQGPDGELNWDRLPEIAVYRGHMSDNLTSTSNGGAVAHATGVRVHAKSFGFEAGSSQQPMTAGGRRETLMQEALRRGVRCAIINSGDIMEPGTAAFVAATEKRKDHEKIALQVCESGASIIMSGGEALLLPKGATGRHGKGKREDGRDLIAEMRSKGYTVVFNREELAKVPANTQKLLGVFASAHTFNDKPDPVVIGAGLPLYVEGAPTLGEMTAKALELLAPSKFFMVIEEEGSDNFGNVNNARGVLEALKHADEAFGIATSFVAKHPDTLLITAADSEAGAMDVIGLPPGDEKIAAIAANGRDFNGSPYGLDLEGKPFVSAPDSKGVRHQFVVVWGTLNDTSGGILVRAIGKGSELVRGTVDNVGINRVMRKVLFPDRP